MPPTSRNLGRQATKISELEAEIAGGLAAVQAAERERAENAMEMNALRGELGAVQKALYDAEGLIDRRQNEFLEYVRLQESMKVLSEMRFAALAASDARVASLELRLGEVSRSLIEAEQKLAQRELHARSLTDVLGGVRTERESAEARVADLEARLAEERTRAEQLAQEVAAIRQHQDGEINQLKTLMVKMNVNEAALEESRRRELDAIARRDHMAERAKEADRILEDYARLRAEHSAVQGALDVARKRGEDLAAALAQANRNIEPSEISPRATAMTMRLCARASAKSAPPSSGRCAPMAMARPRKARRALRQFPDCCRRIRPSRVCPATSRRRHNQK